MNNFDDEPIVRVSREDLYEQVWSIPLRTLAQRFGLSDVGLAKTCKRMNVPLPGRGYWAKKAAGKVVKQVPLPRLQPNAGIAEREVQFGPRAVDEEATLPIGPVGAQAECEHKPENLIVVSDSLRSPHPLVRKTLEALRGKARSGEVYVGNWREPHLDVQVSHDMLNRALRVMDALVKGLEERGWKVVLGTGDDRKTYVQALGQRVPFGIREKLKKVKNEPAKPVRSSTGDWYTPYRNEFRDEPSGRLSLVLRNRWGNSVDKSWDDGASQRVEDRLNEFVLGIITRAEEDRERERQLEEAERVRFEEEQRRLEAAHQREMEASRERELDRQADNWQKSQRLTAFIAAVRRAADQETGEIETGSPLDSCHARPPGLCVHEGAADRFCRWRFLARVPLPELGAAAEPILAGEDREESSQGSPKSPATPRPGMAGNPDLGPPGVTRPGCLCPADNQRVERAAVATSFST